MKTFRFVQTIVIACAFAICCSADASAQKNHNWREKIMCEKIAFLTTELDLSTKEAQEFWPVYNEYMKEIENAQKAIYVNYKALNEAIKEAKPEKEVAECLDKYLKAQEDKAVLAEAVWGDHADQSDDFQYVYAQMKNLRRKLSDAGADIEIKAVYGFGYKMIQR